MYFPDLSPCTYFGDFGAATPLAVGWLSEEESFSQGATSLSTYERLEELFRAPWQPAICGGVHHCEICQFNPPAGHANLWVPDGTRLYLYPELILHYIAAHGYLPPQSFADAVAACPDPSSMEYKRLMLASGGREMLRAMKGGV